MIEVTFDSPEYISVGVVFTRTLYIGLIAVCLLPVVFRSFSRKASSIFVGVVAAVVAMILGFGGVLIHGGIVNEGLKSEQNQMLNKELPSIIKKEFEGISEVTPSKEKEGYFLVTRENKERASVSIQDEKPGKKPNTTVYTLVLNEPKPKPKPKPEAKPEKAEGDDKLPSAGNANPTQAELDAARVSNKPGYNKAKSEESNEEKPKEETEVTAKTSSDKKADTTNDKDRSKMNGNANPTQAELDAARASTQKPAKK